MEVGEWSISSPASKFLLGAPWSEKLVHGWVHPLRFSSNQLRVIGSCSSWHPGLFKQMAACTSDILVSFITDSSEVVLDLNIDEVPKGASSVLQLLKAAYFKKLSSVFVTVDGKPYKNFSLDDAGEHTLSIHLETETSEDNLARLPGFNDTHHVSVYLPCLQS
ncbi:MAG: GNAT family N-acetyltransferase, partial [Atopobium sp.]|nr:GNAT family N-acetyltransferase [Atopobium sp.]